MKSEVPTPFALNWPDLPDDLNKLDELIHQRENLEANLKKEVNARFVWSKPNLPKQTEYSLVYIHGFSATRGEARPLHTNLASRYGFNLFQARLAGHGYKGTQGFRNLTAQKLVDSAVEALSIGQKIGKKVILMGTSTGAALSLYLAAHVPSVAALLAYSPLIDFHGGISRLLKSAPLRRLAKLWPGNKFIVNRQSGLPNEGRVWNSRYRLEGLLALGEFVEKAMRPEIFKYINQPILLGYYYKDEENQDDTVSVKAMLQMFDNISTANTKKMKHAFPEASSHVISGAYTSKSLKKVEKISNTFLEEILCLSPVKRV